MRFTIAAFGLAAVASASMSYDDKPAMPVMYAPHNTTSMHTSTTMATTTTTPMMTTKVLTEYTTYCPSPTIFTHGPSTYTITEATTLTLGCPCTVSMPVYTTETPTSTPVMAMPPPYYPAKNTTMMAPPPPPTGVVPPPAAGTTPVTPPPVAYTGAANKAAFSFAGVLAAAGFIAAL